MIPILSTRQRIARVPLLGRAHDCVDETGLFSLSYGRKVYAVHTRAGATGIASALDQSGRSFRVPAGLPRVTQEYTGGAWVPALLLEAQRQNTLVHSDDASNASWTKSNVTVSANAAIAPDGTLTGDKIVEDSATASHLITPASTFTPTASTPQSEVRYAKAAERTWLFFQTRDLAGTFALSWVNLATGALGTVAAAHTVRVRPAAFGWWRIEVTWSSNSGGSTCNTFWGPTTGNGVSSYTGDGVSGIYMWRASREVDSNEPSSEIPTGASAVTRASDLLYFPLSLAVQAGSFYARFVERARANAVGLTSTGILYLGAAGGTDPRAFLYRPFAEAGYRFQHDPATATSTTNIGTAATVGDTVELLGQLASTGAPTLHVSINAGAVESNGPGAAQALGAAWSDARVYLNSLGSGNIGLTAFRNWAIAPAGMSLSELRDLCEVG